MVFLVVNNILKWHSLSFNLKCSSFARTSCLYWSVLHYFLVGTLYFATSNLAIVSFQRQGSDWKKLQHTFKYSC